MIIPNETLVKRVYEMRALDPAASIRQIAAATGVGRNSVQRWLANPAWYDPYLDEIALERALEGDREVYENLTIFELQEFGDRLMKMDPLKRTRLSVDLGLSRETLASRAWSRRRSA